MDLPHKQGLYDPANEHDACGVGFIAHIKGQKSHQIILQGLEILKNLDHRGAVGADALQGDGAGLLCQLPDALYREEMARQGVTLPAVGDYGVGMVFLPREHASRLACEEEIERATRAEGQAVLGWRDVPVNAQMPMSPAVRSKEPVIRQIFIGSGPDVMVTEALERKLYVIRRRAANAINALQLKHGQAFYVVSMSARTIVYKGLLLADQVGEYYLDLVDPRAVSALALVHQRFSTNTFPKWNLAHPFRFIAHNGEINTVRGNYNWMRAREKGVHSPSGAGPGKAVAPHLPRPVRLGGLRQRPRTAGDERLFPCPRGDDDDPRGLGVPHPDGREAPRLLRIPRGHDGALGRSGGGGLHRRPADRRDPGPQRPAPGPLPGHR